MSDFMYSRISACWLELQKSMLYNKRWLPDNETIVKRIDEKLEWFEK